MKIEFKQVKKEHVDIIGIDEKTKKKKVIGHIFTPSGSSHTSKNAIQICGFQEAFDLWGCAVFARKGLWGQVRMLDKEKYIQVKDIQLKFNMEIEPHCMGREHDLEKDCSRCYNKPCTCEQHVAFENPYTVKREQDLWLEKKELT